MTRIATSTLEMRKAHSVDEALAILAAERRMPVAGATDVYVGLNFGTLKEKRYLDIWSCNELREITLRGGTLSVPSMRPSCSGAAPAESDAWHSTSSTRGIARPSASRRS